MKEESREISILLHNIRSVHNVGSIFRTGDAAGISKIYLSGYTPLPNDRFGRARKDIAKISLGAEKTIAWEYIKNPINLINKLKNAKYQIIALEQSKNSIDYKKIKLKPKVLIILGNEVEGVSSKLLSICNTVIEIPMKGKKESLNVSVAFGTVLFRILGI